MMCKHFFFLPLAILLIYCYTCDASINKSLSGDNIKKMDCLIGVDINGHTHLYCHYSVFDTINQYSQLTYPTINTNIDIIIAGSIFVMLFLIVIVIVTNVI